MYFVVTSLFIRFHPLSSVVIRFPISNMFSKPVFIMKFMNRQVEARLLLQDLVSRKALGICLKIVKWGCRGCHSAKWIKWKWPLRRNIGDDLDTSRHVRRLFFWRTLMNLVYSLKIHRFQL